MLLGAVADDLTGATDLSLTLSREGMRTVQVVGVPPVDFDFGDADAVVVALKSRTTPAETAVAMSREAAQALLSAGPGRSSSNIARPSIPRLRAISAPLPKHFSISWAIP
ncbi:four-carbon acid sugar kinase family protein [Sinorhizobium sp. BG8]|uniref:four-carbon acid sugar kinase family protein n=1 Tax=Sinorhizobium sp. BG8 TaxID=2613773 RepID=UPI0032B12F7C